METKQLEKILKGLQTNYKTIFNTDEGKEVLADLEKDVIIILPQM